jgi:murein L,D-transpeptidase YafK
MAPVETLFRRFPLLLISKKTLQRPSTALSKNEAVLKKQFEDKKLVWPAKYVYIRSFKYDSQLEIWVKNDRKDPYRLFKTYKVCALAGTLGPKRMGGDYQVPEGFYYINEFNPKSNYHLSLGSIIRISLTGY